MCLDWRLIRRWLQPSIPFLSSLQYLPLPLPSSLHPSPYFSFLFLTLSFPLPPSSPALSPFPSIFPNPFLFFLAFSPFSPLSLFFPHFLTLPMPSSPHLLCPQSYSFFPFSTLFSIPYPALLLPWKMWGSGYGRDVSFSAAQWRLGSLVTIVFYLCFCAVD